MFRSIMSVFVAQMLPLHIACANGDAKVVELLIERGAQSNATDGNGVSYIHVSDSFRLLYPSSYLCMVCVVS